MKNIDLKKTEKETPSPTEDLNALFDWRLKRKNQGNPYFQLGALIFLLIIGGFFFWQKNYFGTIAILGSIFLIFLSQKREEEIYCAILKGGIRVNNELFSWKNIESFWIFEEAEEIYFKTKKAFVQNVPVPILKEDSGKIKNLLKTFIPEKKAQISLSEIIIRNLGI